MKAWKRILCILMFSVIFTSCHATPPEQTSDIVASDAPTREEVFANRERSQRVVVETVKDFEFTVTFDREVYYMGDDIHVHVVAKYIGNDPDFVLKDGCLREKGDFIDGMLYADGEALPDGGKLDAVQDYPDQSVCYPLVYGETLENAAMLTTAIVAEKLEDASQVMLRVGVYNSDSLDVPITVIREIPQDTAFLPYTQSGEVTPMLSLRLAVATDDELVAVRVAGRGLDSDLQFAGIDWQEESYGYDFSGWCRLMTRSQLLTLLEYREAHPNENYCPFEYDVFQMKKYYPMEEGLS